MTVRRRLERLEAAPSFARPDAPNITPQELVAIARSRAWTLDDWRIAFGEAQIDRVRSELIDDAQEARRRRGAGEDPWLGLPTHVAAEILSYLPGEDVPAAYAGYIDRHFQDPPPPALVAYLVGAAMAAIVLDTRDGMDLRIHLWGHRTSDDNG